MKKRLSFFLVILCAGLLFHGQGVIQAATPLPAAKDDSSTAALSYRADLSTKPEGFYERDTPWPIKISYHELEAYETYLPGENYLVSNYLTGAGLGGTITLNHEAQTHRLNSSCCIPLTHEEMMAVAKTLGPLTAYTQVREPSQFHVSGSQTCGILFSPRFRVSHGILQHISSNGQICKRHIWINQPATKNGYAITTYTLVKRRNQVRYENDLTKAQRDCLLN